ncbi:MAG: hypothetical protein IJ187_09530 [Neisseriaceae bacterium]|nr:hypothetical protein [Neisseriaceae bacterium]MBR1818738.1 hypothetical protein [Neisseriaceae bacterium]
MSYAAIEHSYNTLTQEQQVIVNDLIVSLAKLNKRNLKEKARPKRTFGQFSGRATAIFSNTWSMTEDELCK